MKQVNLSIPKGMNIVTKPSVYKIKGVVHGSYGETCYRQIGKEYDDIYAAVAAGIKAVARGCTDVVLVNSKTGRRFMLDNIVQAMAEIAESSQH
jgi:hypothetical protein